jgi:maleate cis-trans isomerase
MHPSPPALGFLYPGHAAEDEYPRLAGMLPVPLVAEVVHTALGENGDAHTIEALRDMGEGGRLAAGAEELRKSGISVVIWACTSGSFVYGWEGAHRQAAALSEQLGIPASSTSLAFVSAARAVGARRVAIAATYPADVAACFAGFLNAAGIEVCELSAAGVMTATQAGRLDEAAVLRMVRDADRPDADAVMVPDTALHTIDVLPQLEVAVGKPVLTANQVSLWEACRLTGLPVVCARAGTLFAGGALPAAARAAGRNVTVDEGQGE